jgi:hypothetical protein
MAPKAFSSEVDTGSPKENVKEKTEILDGKQEQMKWVR